MSDDIHQKTAIESDKTVEYFVREDVSGPAIKVSSLTAHSYVMSFKNEAGQTARIELKDGKVTYSGELPVDESAALFFKHVIMQWRNFGRDEEYESAKLAAIEAGYTDNNRLAQVINDQHDTIELWRTVLETIRYEAKQENSERMTRILGYANRTLGIKE
jgi:hypothetical protein